ncbi:uncharacterized protein LOC117183134 [Belonocnema kinseyi]|uniref:uncharacterized protein LOC117183134 n=1 Tax=Belonocnema kinseyi TaxID=2817044 RepID=UPI00143D5E66|nr:uncharacterized protein LOC117183134 [Belonocnema kinseyi]
MTVMLLQRFATPQLTHSQKTANHNNSEPPFVFLLEIEEHTNNGPSNNNNNNNNNHNNNNSSYNNNINSGNYECSYINSNTNNSANVGKFISTSRSNVTIGGVSAAKSLSRLGAQGVAMRYYRLWIYACNIVLLGSAFGFAAAVSRTLLFSGDPRRYLVPGVPRAFDPTALYAYLALAIQLGLVQLLGCIAARRLSARLLNAYWILLLALLFGDVVIGVAWVFRFERMRAELRPTLRLRLQGDYNKESRFSEQWDRLQRDFSCCGVTDPQDFGSHWPQTCCGPSSNVSEVCEPTYAKGCEEYLMDWLRKTADLLFVLGFCVIAFTKLCFLGILRYEIREMIQKIKLLREPPPQTTTFIQSFSQGPPDPTNNGNFIRRTTLPSVTAPSGNAPLLLQNDDCAVSKHPLLANNLQDGGADSDTNSHCALILEETTPTSTIHNCSSKEKSNGNNNYEMREFNRRLLLPNGGSPGVGITTGGQSRRT